MLTHEQLNSLPVLKECYSLCEDSNDTEDSIIPQLRKLGSLSNLMTIIQFHSTKSLDIPADYRDFFKQLRIADYFGNDFY